MSVSARTLVALGLMALSAATAARSLQAQAPYKVGTRYEAFLNTSGKGSPQLFSQVYYPATSDGYQAPIARASGKLPVLVFMHGFTALGSHYVELAFDWARAGYIVVLQNTAASDPPLQIEDGIAMYPALVREATSKGSFYENVIDSARIVIAGHSVGGSGAIHVLARNPGYRAGLAWSPYAGADGKYTDSVGPQVRVPFGIVTGTGDVITPLAKHSQPAYAALATNSIKFLHVLDDDANHATLVSWLQSKAVARGVFERSMRIARGLFDHVLYDDDGSLDESIGLSARSDKHHRAIEVDLDAPCYIKRGVDTLGGTATFQLVAPAGSVGLHLLGLGFANTQTPIGTLHIDTALSIFTIAATTQLSGDFSVYKHSVPSDPRMKGLRFPVQVLLATGTKLALSNPLELAVPK